AEMTHLRHASGARHGILEAGGAGEQAHGAGLRTGPVALANALMATAAETTRAHSAFLTLTAEVSVAQQRSLAHQSTLLAFAPGNGSTTMQAEPHVNHDRSLTARGEPLPPVTLTREQCLEFAVGSIAKVLGPRFAEAD